MDQGRIYAPPHDSESTAAIAQCPKTKGMGVVGWVLGAPHTLPKRRGKGQKGVGWKKPGPTKRTSSSNLATQGRQDPNIAGMVSHDASPVGAAIGDFAFAFLFAFLVAFAFASAHASATTFASAFAFASGPAFAFALVFAVVFLT